MYIYRIIFAFVCLLFAQSASGEEMRVDWLVGSKLFDRVEEGRIWATKISNSKIEYSCLKCDGSVDAVIEIIAPYTSENYRSVKQRYLSERKVYCAKLVTFAHGRCLHTNEIRMRGDSLSGFSSEQETISKREYETIFFYNYFEYGPELIKGTISIEDGATLPNDTMDMLIQHMLRLTVFY